MADQDRDQKTEQATPQRISKAFEEGQIGYSADLIGGVMLAVGAFYFWMVGEWMFGSLGDNIRFRVTYFRPMIEDPLSIADALSSDVIKTGMVVLGLMLPLFIVALLGGALQTNFNVTFKSMTLKWEKMSVPSGFKRIFSISSVVRGAFSIGKAAIIVGILYYLGRSQFDAMEMVAFTSFKSMMFVMCKILLQASIAIAATLAVLGVADLAFQKWKQSQDLKMSIQEIKDEHKENEGDPLVKARIKRLQAEMGRNRMLADVPKASVVITNPTHFAVAVQYDGDNMDAPIVLAKGADHLAKKIIAIAKENGVPVVERKPVARFLYANTKVGNQIPFELYQAVAEIINYVSRINRKSGAA
ncbi:flagellar biosynthesis protein FlhB [Mariniblastus fucicola]|uniref:Flagellar biosynthetic protein FlhB n=1 Tax=Mariniblastus fucicola TaxID=980251 RepID=A0A5B9PAS3_9BACT|nr:flagellar biosynthesis protein FlhB [Mariniblastus fucicola]QEG23364.1 Flagellar biosynthetic protein FlhB [Mariniblastus fucicola]